MFDGIRNFFERMKGTMFDKNTISRETSTTIAVSDKMCAAQQLWKEMYVDKTGLHLPSAIAFEMARLVTLEFRSRLRGSNRSDYLDKHYQSALARLRVPLEYGLAKGGLVMKPYVSGDEILVDFITADNFFPTEFDSCGNIRGAVFVQRYRQGERFYTRLEKHSFSGNQYQITNTAFVSHNPDFLGNPCELGDVEAWKDMSPTVSMANIKKPLFGYFRPAAANCIEPGSPMGVSVFAKATNLINDADAQYRRLLWEFESGERAIVANAMAFRRDRDGKPRLPDRRLYRTLEVEDMDFFKEWSPQLRQEELSKGLNCIMRQIEFNCGLAYGTLSDVSHNDKTAEEIRMSKQRSYATVSDNQKALKAALLDLVYAMDVWCTLYSLAPRGAVEAEFDFDDSVIADRTRQFEERRALVELGVMEPQEFREWYFG